MSELIDDALLGADEPFTRWSTVVAYPPDHPGQQRGRTFRFRGDGSRRLAQLRADAHEMRGAMAVVQRQEWTPGPWTDVDPLGEAGSAATPKDLELVGPGSTSPEPGPATCTAICDREPAGEHAHDCPNREA